MSFLVPCPGCGRTRRADEGHYLCRECEGYRGAKPHREHGRCPLGDECPCWQEGYQQGAQSRSSKAASDG